MNPKPRTPLAPQPLSPSAALPPADPDRRLDTDVALLEQLAVLMMTANQRQVWLFFLDDERRLAEPIMPMDDYPLEPDELCDTDDLGRVPFSEVFIDRAQLVCRMIAAREFVVVWERPGGEVLSPVDRRWVRAVTELMERRTSAADSESTPLRGQLLLHDGGLRMVEDGELG